MSINDKKGINLTSGFKYVGGQPLDVRLIAEDESDLQSLVDNGATYNGMVVWVNSTSKRKVFNGSEFIEDVSPDTIGNINDVLEQINGGGTFSGGGTSSGGSSETIYKTSLGVSRTKEVYLNIGNSTLTDYVYMCGFKNTGTLTTLDNYGGAGPLDIDFILVEFLPGTYTATMTTDLNVQCLKGSNSSNTITNPTTRQQYLFICYGNGSLTIE